MASPALHEHPAHAMRPWLALAIAAGIVIAALPTLPLGHGAVAMLDDGLQVAVLLVVSWAAFWRARSMGGPGVPDDSILHGQRRGWMLLGLAALSYGLGQLLWMRQEAIAGTVPTGPAPMDIAYLLFYPLAAAGLLILWPMARRRSMVRLGVVLDGLLVALPLFILAWPLLLDPAFEAIGETWTGYVTVAYPLGDILLLGLMLGMLLRRPDTSRTALGVLALAIGILTVTDIAYATDVFSGTYATGTLVDVGWVIAFLLVAAATRAPMALAEAKRAPSRLAVLLPRVLPMVAVGTVVLAFVLVRSLGADRDPVWALSCVVVLVASLARQLLTERENLLVARSATDAQANYKALFENMEEAVAHCRMVREPGKPLDWTYLHVNPAFARLTGLAAAEGRRVTELIPDIHATNAREVEAFDRVARGGSPERLEYPVPSLSGWFAVSVYSPQPDEFIAVFDNITERKQREQARLLSEARLKEAQRLAHIGSWDYDLVTGRSWWSDEMYRLLRRDRATFRPGQDDVLASLHPDDRARVESAWKDSVRGEAPFDTDARVVHEDGSPGWIHIHGEATHDAAGKPTRSWGTAQDVSATKKAEADREVLADRDREVKALQEQNKFRIDFLNAAAHDLKTPLTPLKLQMATLRMRGGLDEKQKSSLDLMERNVNRFQALVEDMLDAARLQSGRVQLHREDIQLAPLVEEAVASFREAATQAGIELRMDVDDHLRIDADPDKVVQVLMNLVSNAVKYTPKGGHIRVSTPSDGKQAMVRVVDDGLGLSASQRARLFQPFVRVHEDIPGVAGGTGLGLYISRGLTEQHGGHLWAESAGPGQGSTFVVTWPLTPAPVGHAAAA